MKYLYLLLALCFLCIPVKAVTDISGNTTEVIVNTGNHFQNNGNSILNTGNAKAEVEVINRIDNGSKITPEKEQKVILKVNYQEVTPLVTGNNIKIRVTSKPAGKVIPKLKVAKIPNFKSRIINFFHHLSGIFKR